MTQLATTNNYGMSLPQFDASWVERYVYSLDCESEATRTSYTNDVKMFLSWLSYSAISSPTREDIIRYRDWLSSTHDSIKWVDGGFEYQYDKAGSPKSGKCSPSTVNQYVNSVKRLFAWLSAEGLYPNIASSVKPGKVDKSTHRKDALTPEEVEMVEQGIESHFQMVLDSYKPDSNDFVRATENYKRTKAMWLLTVTAGLRTIEVSRLTVGNFIRKGDSYSILVHGKGHKEADTRLPIAPEVGEAISEYLSTREAGIDRDSPLFASTSNRNKGGSISSKKVGDMISQCLAWGGVKSPTVTPHSLRHTAGTTALRETGNIYTAQCYMRHKSPQTTEIYTHVDTEMKNAETAQTVYNALHGGVTEDDERAMLHSLIDGMSIANVKAMLQIARGMAN